jgi:hypothetical protein
MLFLLLIPGVAHAEATARTQDVTTRVTAPLSTAPLATVASSVGHGAPISAAPAFEVSADAHVQRHVISHASERATGWWILGVMGSVGVASTTVGMLQTCGSDQTCQEWTSLAIWSGIAVTTAGALLGIPKIVTSDEVTLTVVPGTAPLRDPGHSDRLGTEQASVILGGATLAGRF